MPFRVNNDTVAIMYASVDIIQGVVTTAGRWLLLIHQIPPKPDYFRVKVRRRLQRIGAVALKNSVYVLPNTDEATEDFQWLRRAVVDEGGEATVCIASFVEGMNDQEVESMFRAQVDAEYSEIVDAARAAAAGPSDADVRRLKRQLGHIEARDFFAAAGAAAARLAVGDLETALARRGEAELSPTNGSNGIKPRGATWVTRRDVYVDRMASAWLIRRFIDPAAQFKFVLAKGYHAARGELCFDMFEGEFTHEGDSCTFEVLVARFELGDAALRAIAQIVHDIDCKDEKYGREEAAGVASVLSGMTLAHSDDVARVAAATALFDGLYASFQRRSG